MLTAITRAVSPSIGRCLLTHMDRDAIDAALAQRQHGAYCDLLRELGVDVHVLPALPDLPDAVFVEDNVVIADEVAVLASMGSKERAPEVDHIAEVVGLYRPLERIEPPATLEGGDTFRVDRTFFVGLSTRTNPQGAQRLAEILEPHAYEVRTVPVTGCLHLSTGASHVGGGLVLVNPEWIDASAIARCQSPRLRIINVHPDEPWAANTMLVGDTLVMPAGFPKTQAMLEAQGCDVRTVDVSELMKAEAGLTCMRKLFQAAPVRVKGARPAQRSASSTN